MIRVLIIDDQRLMREGLRTLLALEPDIEVVGLAADGEEGLLMASQNEVDVALVDIRMPNMDGITTVSHLQREEPQVRALMLTTFDDKEDVVAALAAGAKGYLLKDMPAEAIASAIRTAHAGGAVLPPNIAQTFLSAWQSGTQETQTDVKQGSANGPVSPMASVFRDSNGIAMEDSAEVPLTEREREVMRCLAQGMSNREIADTLYVTEGTVKNHVSNLIAKLGLRDRTQVALYAVRLGHSPR